jgi:acyl-CoA reductase-like NAD-dependent aldehyde dehydrogenase
MKNISKHYINGASSLQKVKKLSNSSTLQQIEPLAECLWENAEDVRDAISAAKKVFKNFL